MRLPPVDISCDRIEGQTLLKGNGCVCLRSIYLEICHGRCESNREKLITMF